MLWIIFDLQDLFDKKHGVNNCNVHLHLFTLFVSQKYSNVAFSCIVLGGIDQVLLPSS
jgi:hypothetical protein